MLTVSDIALNQTCAGLSRRNFLQAGVLGSLALPDLLANRALAVHASLRTQAPDEHHNAHIVRYW
jgi:hypothetical protein